MELGACVGELEPTHPPVVRIEVPLDEPGRLEPVDVVRDRRALEVNVRGERGLVHAADVAQGAEHDPDSERAAGGRERVLERLSHRLRGEHELTSEWLHEVRCRVHHIVRY